MRHLSPGPFGVCWSLLIFATGLVSLAHAQAPKPAPDQTALRVAAHAATLEEHAQAVEVDRLSQRLGLRRAFSTPRGAYELVRVERGLPVYLQTLGVAGDSAASTQQAYAAAALTGAGIQVGIWDGGAVRKTHQEVVGRVDVRDRYASVQSHATHLGGIIGGSGIVANAKGVAPGATLRSHDWGRDRSEMITAASEGLRVSNHSYGQSYGWVYNVRGDGRWAWLGDLTADSTRDHRFGTYDWLASAWDEIAYDAPTYLIVKAAGNDRGEGPTPGAEHWIIDPVRSQWVLSTTTRELDGGTTGYQTVLDAGNGKNILTVGAVRSDGTATLSTSAWGPTADGRIKPDLTAWGENVYSATATSDQSYGTMSGTSMATAAVTGTVAGLLELESRYQPATPLRASTYRALLLHTAQDAGATGPDYAFGWGVLDRDQAAAVFESGLKGEASVVLREETIAFGAEYSLALFAAGNRPLRVTVAWTDPEGTAVTDPMLPATPTLVNDLDVWVTSADGRRFDPWVLDPSQPAAPATTGRNVLDNVEQVDLSNPAEGPYTLHVAFARQNAGGTATQVASILVTGLSGSQESLPVELTAFEGVASEGGALLRWETASETNNAGFAIEHRPGADAPWQETAFVSGHGTTVEAHRYEHAIPALAPGLHRFRLRQVDFDGTTAYSAEVEIEIRPEGTFALSPFAPNPFGTYTKAALSVARAQHVEAGLFDLTGRRVAVLFEGMLDAGQQATLAVDGSALPPGLYLVRVTGETFAQTARLTLVR